MSAAPTGLANSVREVFLVPPSFEKLAAALIERVELLSTSRKMIAQAFLENLNGVILTLSIPFAYTYSQVHSLHWQRFLMAEHIRARSLPNEAERESSARTNAKSKFEEFLASQNGLKLSDEVLGRLADLKEEPDALLAARELTRQGVVLIWSAFEVLARDFFVDLLNEHPTLADRLLAHTAGRKRFTVEKVDWQTLSGFGFNLSSSLGTLLAQRADLDDIQTIRDAFDALFPTAAKCNQSLGDSRLWHLFQTRNLIVHRRGVVDQLYIEKTGSKLPIGTHLWVTPTEIEDFFAAVVAAVEEIVGEVTNVG
jgi:hypothetical protein